MQKIKYIAKIERFHGSDHAALYFPEYSANFGNIFFYVHCGQHGEADTLYYKGLRNPKTEADCALVSELVCEYERNFLNEGETLVKVARDSAKMQAARWKRG